MNDEMIAAFLETAAERFETGFAGGAGANPEARLRAACERLFVSPGDAERVTRLR